MVGLIIVVVLLSYIGIASICLYLIKGIRKKLVALVIFLLIPTADVIVGRVYFSYLCGTQSGQFIHKTVEVGEEYLYLPGEMMRHKLDETGQRLAIAKGGEINQEKLRERYDFPFAKRESYSNIFHIYKRERIITDKTNNEILSKSVSFLYVGGWVFHIYPVGETVYCDNDQKPVSDRFIHSTIFDKTFLLP